MKDAELLMLPCLAGLLISIILIMCTKYDTIYPHCLVLLGTFTLSLSLIASYLTTQTSARVVLQTLALTLSVVFGSTMFVMRSGVEFSFFGPVPWALGFVFGTFAIIYMLFNKDNDLSIFWSLAGAVVFTLYLIGDIILLLRGAAFCFNLTRERHILCAISLYLDTVVIFVYLLALLGE